MQPRTVKSVDALIDAVVRGELDGAQTLRLCAECPELVTLALLAAGKRIAGLQVQSQDHQPSPSTPSGMVPIYTKPNTTKRHKKPGAKKRHPGHRRGRPNTIYRDYYPKCKKHVEPVVPDAMPGATFGHHVIALTAWLHYGLGITIDQIVNILGYHMQTN